MHVGSQQAQQAKSRKARVWDASVYLAAVAKFRSRSQNDKSTRLWMLDEHGRLVRKNPPHQVLLPVEPIPNQNGGFLQALDLGAAARISAAHQDLLHAGAYKVHQYLTKKLNFFVSRRIVEKALVNNCSTCMRRQVRRVPVPLVPVRAFWPMQRVQLDFMDFRGKRLCFPRKMQPGNWDGGTKSKMEYKVDYVLVAVCVFSAYAWCRPLYNNSQWEVCYEATKLFNEFGWPQILHTDNGPPFGSKMLASLCIDHDTFLAHGRAYHPQSQGKVERLIRTLKTLVSSLQDAILPKPEYLYSLARAVFVYNRTCHAKTGISPFAAFYGRHFLEGVNFRGEFEMNAVEQESRERVTTRRTYHGSATETQQDSHKTLTQYVKQLPLFLQLAREQQDEGDRASLFEFLLKQQPQLLGEIQALQNHRNLEMVRRSMRQQGELKPVHIGDRVVFCKMSGLELGMAHNPLQNLLVGTVIDEHVGGVLQAYTIQCDDKQIHIRIPRESIGIRIPGYTVTSEMKGCASRNIVSQAQSLALRLGQTVGIETPASIGQHTGRTQSSFAQVPVRDAIPDPGIEVRAQRERQRLLVAEGAGKVPAKSESDDASATVASGSGAFTFSHHGFSGASCPGVACDSCNTLLGGRGGKYCRPCFKESGCTLCNVCHSSRQQFRT